MRYADAEEAVRLLGLELVRDVGVGEVPRPSERGSVVGKQQQHTRECAGGEPEERTDAETSGVDREDRGDHRRLVLEEDRRTGEESCGDRASAPGEDERAEAAGG